MTDKEVIRHATEAAKDYLVMVKTYGRLVGTALHEARYPIEPKPTEGKA